MSDSVKVVISVEHDPPLLLGTLMPAREDDEGIVRYFDSGRDEEEGWAPDDCVVVKEVWVR